MPKRKPMKRSAVKRQVKRPSAVKSRRLSAPQAQAEFVKWVKAKDPALYQLAIKRAQKSATLGGIFDVFTSVVNTVKDVAPKVFELSQQKKILDLQIDQAKAGMAPLNVNYTPTVPVSQVATAPVQARIEAGAEAASKQDEIMKFLPLAALLFLPKLLGILR